MAYQPSPDGKGGVWVIDDHADMKKKQVVTKLATLGALVIAIQREDDSTIRASLLVQKNNLLQELKDVTL